MRRGTAHDSPQTCIGKTERRGRYRPGVNTGCLKNEPIIKGHNLDNNAVREQWFSLFRSKKYTFLLDVVCFNKYAMI